MLRRRALLPLLVLVPVLAYLAAVMAEGPDGPPRPTPVILEQSDRTPGTSRDEQAGPDGRDDEEERRGDPVVVTPRPTGLDDDAGSADTGDDDAGEDDTDD